VTDYMKIATILKSNLAITFEQGEKVRDRIIKRLYHGKRVTVDCGGLICMTSDFVYPITDLLLLFSKEHLNENIRFTNISKTNAELIRRCIANTLNEKENDNKISE